MAASGAEPLDATVRLGLALALGSVIGFERQ
jgi:uncharacterized membrane protein YhiD involved in acid resistance